MTDRTNAPYDPAAAETPHEWAARVGQEHDTWHRSDGGAPPTSGFAITSLTPSTVIERQHDTVIVEGREFTNNARVWVGTAIYTTTFISDTQLSFDPYGVGSGTRQIRVEGEDAFSNVLPLTVTDVPLPIVTSAVPNTASIAAGIVTVAVTGSNFVSGATVELAFLGSAPTTFISSTELSAEIDPSLSTPGTSSALSVQNPDGGKSAGISFNITA